MKILLESQRKVRHIGDNIFTFLQTNKIQEGSMVSIGYIKDKELSWGPRTRKVINAMNDERLSGFIAKMDDSPMKQALINFQNSEKYQTALKTGKTAPFNIEGDVHIVKVSRFLVNWKGTEGLAKFYADRGEAEQNIRTKYGFGKDESEYDETDWRRKPEYKGTGIRPEVTKFGNKYKAIGQSGFYAHIDEPNKVSLRQIPNLGASRNVKPYWYFVDTDGKFLELDRELMAFLTFAYSNVKETVKDIVEESSEEEKQFIEELNKIPNRYTRESTLILDKFLYLVGTTGNVKQGTDESFAWINDKVIMQYYPYFNPEELNKIIQKCIKLSDSEIQSMNEKILPKYNKKQALYENIMNKMSKIVKRKMNNYLNEGEDMYYDNMGNWDPINNADEMEELFIELEDFIGNETFYVSPEYGEEIYVDTDEYAYNITSINPDLTAETDMGTIDLREVLTEPEQINSLLDQLYRIDENPHYDLDAYEDDEF